VGMPILNAIKNPQGLVKALIGVVGLVVLFGLSYAISGSEVTARAASLGIDASSSRMIGAGMIMFYIILLVSTVLAVFSLVRDIISG
jgi:TRAP-type C4-dicarboxylate transport system permease small subunit